MELRERIARILRDEADRWLNERGGQYPPSRVEDYLRFADAVLAIPEIKDGLEMQGIA